MGFNFGGGSIFIELLLLTVIERRGAGIEGASLGVGSDSELIVGLSWSCVLGNFGEGFDSGVPFSEGFFFGMGGAGLRLIELVEVVDGVGDGPRGGSERMGGDLIGGARDDAPSNDAGVGIVGWLDNTDAASSRGGGRRRVAGGDGGSLLEDCTEFVRCRIGLVSGRASERCTCTQSGSGDGLNGFEGLRGLGMCDPGGLTVDRAGWPGYCQLAAFTHK